MNFQNVILIKLITGFISKWLKNYTNKFKVDVNDLGNSFEIKITVNESLKVVGSKIANSLSGLIGVKK